MEIINLVKAITKKHGKKDITKLVKKRIIDSKGRITTVYVLPEWSVISKILKFFGLKTESDVDEKIKKDYHEHKIKDKYHITEEQWKEHFIEYFKNKEHWDKLFNSWGKRREKTEEKQDKDKQKEKGTEEKGTEEKVPREKKKKWNIEVMRYLYELYGNKQEVKEKQEEKQEEKKEEGGKAQERVSMKAKKEELYSEVGEHVWGTRKDIIAKYYSEHKKEEIKEEDLKVLEELGIADQYVTKKRYVGTRAECMYEYFERNGTLVPEVALSAYAILNAVGEAPKDDSFKRMQYIAGIQLLKKLLYSAKSMGDIQEAVRVIIDNIDGAVILDKYEEEYSKYREEFRQIVKQIKDDIADLVKLEQLKPYHLRKKEDDFVKEHPLYPKLEEVKSKLREIEVKNINEIREDKTSFYNVAKDVFGEKFRRFFAYIKNGRVIGLYVEETMKKLNKYIEDNLEKALQEYRIEYHKRQYGEVPEELKEEQKKKREKRKTVDDILNIPKDGLKWLRSVPNEYIRTGGEVKEYTSQTLKDDFGFKNVQFGVYMDLLSSRTHVQRCGEAFTDLANVLGIQPKQLSWNGTLSIAFGARGSGNAAAHYEPLNKIINITKIRGGGSLAHEYGHFIDNMLGMLENGKNRPISLISDTYKATNPELPQKLKDALNKVYRAIYKGDNYSRYKEKILQSRYNIQEKQGARYVLPPGCRHGIIKKVETEKDKYVFLAHYDKKYMEPILPLLDELGIKHKLYYARENTDVGIHFEEGQEEKIMMFAQKAAEILAQNRRKDYEKDSNVYNYTEEMIAKNVKEDREKILNVIGTITAPYVQNDFYIYVPTTHPEDRKSGYYITSKIMGEYASLPTEMFARAFDAYIYEKLKQNNIRNNYLNHVVSDEYVENTKSEFSPIEKSLGIKNAHIVPIGEERKRIVEAFDELMSAIKEYNLLEKAIRMMIKYYNIFYG